MADKKRQLDPEAKPDDRVCVDVGIYAEVDLGIESSDRDFAGQAVLPLAETVVL